MLTKEIIWFGRKCKLVCDSRCDKAWGHNGRRPAIYFDVDGKVIPTRSNDNPDDFAYLADDEVGTAPADPGTYEGGHGKPSATPLTDPLGMNKWCARECERSNIIEAGEEIRLPDFSKRLYNIPSSEERDRKLSFHDLAGDAEIINS